MQPWKDGGADAEHARAAKLATLVAEQQPASVDMAGWDLALEKATKKSSRLVPTLAAFAAASAMALGAFVVWSRTHPVGITEVLVASQGANWATQADGTLKLDSGRIELSHAISTPVRLATPQVEIEARNARFAADVTEAGTAVTLFEGELIGRSGDSTRQLNAGETYTWPATPQISQSLAAPAVLEPTKKCAASAPGERVSCLRHESAGSGLEAQAALYELGLNEAKAGRVIEAQAAYDESLRRFPDGVFAPEAHLSLLISLTESRRFTRAVSVAKDFEARFTDDPRRAEVAALREKLETMK
jgi:TolA-binding protein